MKGDFTRLTFDPAKHYVAVRAQQGRVSVDADVNELQDIADHLRTASLADLVGPAGAPADGGLGVAVGGGGTDVGVTAGRVYVDGVLVEVDEDASLTDQPYLPAGAAVARAADGTWVALADAPEGRYLAYLDAFRHHVTAIDDPGIREVALGGPDTATREQLRWQVRLLRVGDEAAPVGCADEFAAWDAVTAAPTGVLAARAEPDATVAGPCIVPADAGFRRIDNQLYRVEIHDAGQSGVATWKASRDNGSVERRLVGIVGDDLLVSRPGRDAADGFPSGCWVELTDEVHALTGLPGTLVRVVSADGDAIRIDPATATGTLDAADFAVNPRVRRWDTDGPRLVESGPGDGYLELEDGVQVRFSAGASWHTGDYWTIPARVATGDVEWPQDAGVPADVGPHGVAHHFARLCLLDRDAAGTWTLGPGCLAGFPALTALRTLALVAGDGQEALPDPSAPGALVSLARPLVAGVATGSLPVAGARVRFEVTAGAGALAGTAAGTPVVVPTDAAGLASVSWAVDATTGSQQVTARLLTPAGAPEHLPVVFGAELAVAAHTAFDPAACPPLTGAVTVQDAIERLCGLTHSGCASLTLSPGKGWQDALGQLPAGRDAVVCFRPGEYVTDRVVELVGLGHVTLHGGGPASVLRGVGIERVLEVRAARSVHVADLDIRGGAVGVGVEGHEHVSGALTVVDTPEVTLQRLHVRSVGGARRQASCLTVRGTPLLPARVRVRDCELTVGHAQLGILLVDCDDAQVTGNRVTVARKTAALSLDKLVADAGIRSRLVDRLVSGVGEDATPPRDANTVVDVPGWRLAFNSAVPAREWAALVAASPPTDADRADPAAVAAYAERLVAGAVEEPHRLEAFGRAVRRLQDSLGPDGFGTVDRGAVLRRLLVADGIAVTPLTAGTGMVRLDVGGTTVTFRSELDAASWRAALAADTRPVPAATSPAGRLRATAARLIGDAAFRRGLPGAVGWFQALADSNPAVAAQGIVVAGRVARAVDVAGNILGDVQVGIQVGVSHSASPGAARDRAGRVRIVDNVLTLRLPVERTRGRYGIFLGNVEHGLVAGNDLRVAARPLTTEVYEEGIRVWGQLGSFLGVRENVVANADTGIRVEPVDEQGGGHQWFVVDNATPHAGQSVVAPPSVRRRDNFS